MDPLAQTTADEASTGWDASTSRFRLTIACHPDLRRIGEVADVEPETLAAGVCRLFPAFGPAGAPDGRPLEDRRVSRQPVRLQVGATGLTLHPTATTRLNGAAVEGAARLSDAVCRQGFLVSFGKGVLVHVREHPDGIPSTPALLGLGVETVRLEAALRRLAPLAGPLLITGPASRDDAVTALLALRGGGPTIDFSLTGAGSAAAVRDALFGAAERPGLVGRAAGGVLWLRDLDHADPGMVPVLEQVLAAGEQVIDGVVQRARVRVVATADTADDLPAALRSRFDDHLEVHPCAPEDAAWVFGGAVVERLVEAGREDLVHRSPGWIGASTMTRLLTRPALGDAREVANLARRVALASPDSAMELPVEAPVDEPTPDAELLATLEANAWRISASARSLGMSPNTLRKRMVGLGIVPASELTDAQITRAAAEAEDDVEQMARLLRVSAQGLRLRMSRAP
jgi:hypothetical protein